MSRSYASVVVNLMCLFGLIVVSIQANPVSAESECSWLGGPCSSTADCCVNPMLRCGTGRSGNRECIVPKWEEELPESIMDMCKRCYEILVHMTTNVVTEHLVPGAIRFVSEMKQQQQ